MEDESFGVRVPCRVGRSLSAKTEYRFSSAKLASQGTRLNLRKAYASALQGQAREPGIKVNEKTGDTVWLCPAKHKNLFFIPNMYLTSKSCNIIYCNE